MRYIISLNSHWLQNGQPSKLEERKILFTHFQLWRLAILEPLGVKTTSVAHLKALIILYRNLYRPVAWQNSYYGPRPLEKGHFTPKNGKRAVWFAVSCNCIMDCMWISLCISAFYISGLNSRGWKAKVWVPPASSRPWKTISDTLWG